MKISYRKVKNIELYLNYSNYWERDKDHIVTAARLKMSQQNKEDVN